MQKALFSLGLLISLFCVPSYGLETTDLQRIKESLAGFVQKLPVPQSKKTDKIVSDTAFGFVRYYEENWPDKLKFISALDIIHTFVAVKLPTWTTKDWSEDFKKKFVTSCIINFAINLLHRELFRSSKYSGSLELDNFESGEDLSELETLEAQSKLKNLISKVARYFSSNFEKDYSFLSETLVNGRSLVSAYLISREVREYIDPKSRSSSACERFRRLMGISFETFQKLSPSQKAEYLELRAQGLNTTGIKNSFERSKCKVALAV